MGDRGLPCAGAGGTTLITGWTISQASSAEDILAARQLFEAYAASLPVDLGYQDFVQELEELPGRYSPPGGALLLAWNRQRQPMGCIALRPIDEHGVCEMKRLYVEPAGRGSGLGKALARALIAQAHRLGYSQMYLDTLPSMSAAQHLYRDLGFEPIAPYYVTPIEGTAFYCLGLRPG